MIQSRLKRLVVKLSKKENDVSERFQAGVPVVAIGGIGTGVVQGLTRTVSGLLRVLVKWNGSGITAETHPSQIERKG